MKFKHWKMLADIRGINLREDCTVSDVIKLRVIPEDPDVIDIKNVADIEFRQWLIIDAVKK